MTGSEMFDPCRGLRHRIARVAAFMLKPVTIEAIYGERFGLEFLRDRLELLIEGSAAGIPAFERSPIEAPDRRKAEREQREHTRDGAVGLHVGGDVEVGAEGVRAHKSIID